MVRKPPEPMPAQAADRLARDLQPLGDITKRAMFGGYGLFREATMFAIIDTTGAAYFRVDEITRPAYEQGGSVPHGAMPYWTIPAAVRSNHDELHRWARHAIDASTAAKRR